jgi:hypothetical protein
MVPMHLRMDLSAIMACQYPTQHMYFIQPPKKSSATCPTSISTKNHPGFLHFTENFMKHPSIFGPQEFRVKAAQVTQVLTMEGLPMTRGGLVGSALRPAGPAPSLAPCSTTMAGTAPPGRAVTVAGAFAVAVAGKAVGTGRSAWGSGNNYGIAIFNGLVQGKIYRKP